MQPVLEFQNVTKEYKTLFQRSPFRALEGFSLTVQEGEIFGFLGPNGSGKTTSIHIALGLMYPTSGRGTMLGHSFGHPRTRRRVGFLAENVAYYQRPAEKLVRFYGGLNAMRDPQLRQRTKDLLQEVDLYEVAQKNTSKFSRGMLQRVGLVQAIVNDPDLLILDEPTSALDPAARVAVRELLLSLKRAGKSVFISSHLLSEIELVCDRIGIMRKGRLVRLGTVEELLESREHCEITARKLPEGFADAVLLGEGIARLSVPAGGQRAAIERIWAAGGEIVSLAREKKTLEEVFLALTAEDEGKKA